MRSGISRNSGDVAQQAEATDLKSVQCGFESLHPYHTRNRTVNNFDMESFTFGFGVGLCIVSILVMGALV